jgi:hypothetical protein
MRKQVIAEIKRIQEVMGVNPSKKILVENVIPRLFRKTIEGFFKKEGDDAFLYLMKGMDNERTWKDVLQGGMKGGDDLLADYPDPDSLLRALSDGVDNPREVDALFRVLKAGPKMEELVESLLTGKTFKEFQLMFPSGKVGKEGRELIAKTFNIENVDDQFIAQIIKRLNQTLKKVPITVGGKTMRVRVPFVFRRAWWSNFGNNWKFRINGKINPRWKGMGYLLGVVSVSEFLSRKFPKTFGLGDVYGGGGIKKEAFSRSFYDNKMIKKEGDDNWIDRNKLPEEKLQNIIQDLKNAGVGKIMDIGVDDNEIIRIYREDIKNGECGPTYFQASQVATEWGRQTNGDLHEDILRSMNFPVKTVPFQFGANLAAEIINAVAGTHIDWNDTTIADFYGVFDLYYDDCSEEGNTRDIEEKIFSDEEKKNMFRGIPSYPNTLKSDRKTYCSTWSGKIHPQAWLAIEQDKPSYCKDKSCVNNYVRNLDAVEFNEIHEGVVPGMGIIYEISENEKSSGCKGIEKETIENYQEVFDTVHGLIEKSIIDANNDEDDG